MNMFDEIRAQVIDLLQKGRALWLWLLDRPMKKN
jgi:hypothetical protein